MAIVVTIRIMIQRLRFRFGPGALMIRMTMFELDIPIRLFVMILLRPMLWLLLQVIKSQSTRLIQRRQF